MEIANASIRDIGPLRRLEAACFQRDAWSLFDLVAVLTWPDVIRLKAVEGNEMIGFVAGELRASQGWAWIATIAVDPRYRRRGFGRELLRACERRLRLPQVRLTVRMSNTAAIHLYESEGYQTLEIWHRYYNDGEDAVVMQKELPAGATRDAMTAA